MTAIYCGSIVIGGSDLQLKKLSRDLNSDDIIILSEGAIL